MKISQVILFSLIAICLFEASQSNPSTHYPTWTYPTTTSPSTTCEYNGKSYPIGSSFQPYPCQSCWCTTYGYVHCINFDCMYPDCVDFIQEKTQCCLICPNGPNCRAPDGTVIKGGDTYKPDPNTHCQCQGVLAQCHLTSFPAHIDPVG